MHNFLSVIEQKLKINFNKDYAKESPSRQAEYKKAAGKISADCEKAFLSAGKTGAGANLNDNHLDGRVIEINDLQMISDLS